MTDRTRNPKAALLMAHFRRGGIRLLGTRLATDLLEIDVLLARRV